MLDGGGRGGGAQGDADCSSSPACIIPLRGKSLLETFSFISLCFVFVLFIISLQVFCKLLNFIILSAEPFLLYNLFLMCHFLFIFCSLS